MQAEQKKWVHVRKCEAHSYRGRPAPCCVFNAYMERGGKRERDAASTAPDHLYISGAVESAADAGALAAHSKYLLNLRILCCFRR